MKAAAFAYHRAATVEEALALLKEHGGRAKLMAGGQSLGPMLNLRLARPPVVVDISAIQDLRQVREEGDTLSIGAGITHAEIEDGRHAPLRGTAMQRVAGGIAYRAVRNRGTVGGSLAHADPAADWVLAMTALGAEIEIAGSTGKRRVAIEDFMQGAYTTVVGDTELITGIRVPRGGHAARWGYYKFCRKPGEFADASCAAWFDPATRTARIAIGALDGAPRLLSTLAAEVAAKGAAAATASAIAAAVEDAMPDKDGPHRKLHTAAVTRCLAQVLGDRA
ncbi:xanthine dehydrogenase family protein subunit M [Pigmentiphaga sp.]|uniref:FAD binding domain-containing protein n=1 Tax=Pigmentiphaga sp. TaxID=1977564 RepID=UPI0025D3CD8F|nr:FAD binding domain-containing protein [Pigmentiphaga sp.]MBX6317507.1 FAD binding domain-containing protein [Pigmentiphaga sp.]